MPESLFNKVASERGLKLYLKRDSSTGVFPRILRNFLEHFIFRTPLVVASEIVQLPQTEAFFGLC